MPTMPVPFPYLDVILYILMRTIGYNQIYSFLFVASIIGGYEIIKNILNIYVETQMRIIRENQGIWEFQND